MREIAALQRPPAVAADTIANKWASVLNRPGHGRAKPPRTACHESLRRPRRNRAAKQIPGHFRVVLRVIGPKLNPHAPASRAAVEASTIEDPVERGGDIICGRSPRAKRTAGKNHRLARSRIRPIRSVLGERRSHEDRYDRDRPRKRYNFLTHPLSPFLPAAGGAS
jgi:hypothetical protein